MDWEHSDGFTVSHCSCKRGRAEEGAKPKDTTDIGLLHSLPPFFYSAKKHKTLFFSNMKDS